MTTVANFILQAAASYERGDLFTSKEQCLHLLKQSYLPRTTRCQTLCLLASGSDYQQAKAYLREALVACDEVRLIQHDFVRFC
jgi:hypothetical protein